MIQHSGAANRKDAAAAAAASRLSKLQESLVGLDEFASEKRSAKREAVLRRTFKSITQYATGPEGGATVWEHSHHIRNACWHGIRTGQPAEQYAACRVLEATSVLLGADQDDWCESLDRPLRRVVTTTNRATPVRMAALRALAMTAFCCASDEVATESLMDLCEVLAVPEFRNESTPVALRATGLDCWALLATTIADLYLAGQDDVQMGRGLAVLELLRDCLDSTVATLRVAAGECVALIHEARLNLGVADDDDKNVTARQFERGSWEGSQWEELMDEVKQRIAELSVESGHHMNKKAKKQQRATFREFMATIVDDEAPEEVINFRNGSLTIGNWREIVQLNFVRHCLQSGFQIQLVTNATLQVIFGADGRALNDYVGGMSQVEKRLVMSKTSEASKLADQKLTRDRRKRQNVKNHFLTADGEDI